MIRQACGGCGTWLAWGLFRCPRCSRVAPSYAALVKETNMPRITVAMGPTNPGAGPGEIGYIEPEHAAEPVVELRGEDGPELVGLPAGAVVVADQAAAARKPGPRKKAPAGGAL